MKLFKYKLILSLAFIVVFSSCERDFTNINQANEDQVFASKDAILAAAVGMTQHFATSSLAPIVEIPGLTTREFGNLSTYLTPSELVAGGIALPNENAGITRLWSRLLRDKGVAEAILANVDDITMDPGTKSGLKAYAKFFKAMTLGYLIQSFEQTTINNQVDGQAPFSNRATVLAECIYLLESAKADLAANAISGEFEATIPGMDLPNMIKAYLARYNLFAGNYNAAINAANTVDLNVMSEWVYDGSNNQNPVFNFAVNSEPDTKPQDNFGLLGVFTPEANDGRIAFYLSESEEVESDYGEHAVENAVGFFYAANTSIPVYLPGEMTLIKAEAYAMLGSLSNAVVQINLIREKTDDVFGVNAGLDAWTGDASNQAAILDEIFKNRSIELFMSGLRLEDSRRIHHDFTPSESEDYFSERNRNFYPYPFEEGANNGNIPDDPAI